jgi:hypothetical protein
VDKLHNFDIPATLLHLLGGTGVSPVLLFEPAPLNWQSSLKPKGA